LKKDKPVSKEGGVNGKPMLSLHDTYLHYFDQNQWKLFAHTLMLSAHFERCVFASELMLKFGMETDV
jgi:hypothetical protein